MVTTRIVRASLGLVTFAAIAGTVSAQSLTQISSQEAATGLRDALVQGAGKAIGALGQENGFLGNGSVKIPLPESLQRVESLMRGIGLGSYADRLVTTMNRAAESAVVEARPLLTEAIRKMSIQDVKGVLTGPSDAATQYFRRSTASALTQRFLPIVKQATSRVQLADTYNNFAGQAANFGLVKSEDANLDNYVTSKALDGLFYMIAQEEKSIRDNPLGAATAIAKKVFGAIGK